MATLSIVEKNPSLKPAVHTRPRKRRPDQIPLRWVSSRMASRGDRGTTYLSSFKRLDIERLPPIKQKDELAGYKSADAFEKYSLYKYTYPAMLSKRPDFPRPPDQLPPNEDFEQLASTYKKEFIPVPDDYERSKPIIPNKGTWEPQSESDTQPMVSLFHSDFKPNYNHVKTRSIRHGMGYVLPHQPIQSKSSSAEDYSWKYQPKAESFKPKTVYNESEKFNATSVQRQSYPQYRPEVYTKSLLEEEIEFDDRKNYSKPRALRDPPQGASVDLLSGSANPVLVKDEKPNLNISDVKFEKHVKLPPIKSSEDAKVEVGDKFEDTKMDDGINSSAQNLIDAYRQSLYSTTYKSDY